MRWQKTQDRLTLRSHVISVFSPAHDGAAIALINVVFHLARHPAAWEELQEEIRTIQHETLDYDLLNSYKFLRHAIKESK